MTKRTRYGGEGCVVGFGLDYACAHIIILAEISSENLLPIRADFVTERDIQNARRGQFPRTRIGI